MTKETFFQMFIDTIPNPIFYKDDHGIYRHCNDAFCEYLGLKKQEIIGCSVYDINPKELADIYYKADMELIKNKGKQIYESKVKYKDESLRDVQFIKAVLADAEDNVIGIVGVMIDITEQKISKKKTDRLLKIKEAMLEINQAIIGINNINELFDLILEKVTQSMVKADFGCILVLDEEENLKIVSSKGYDCEKAKDFIIKLKESFIWYVTKGNIEKTVIINDIQEMITYHEFPSVLENEEKLEVKSSISCPIIVEGCLYGLVNIDSKTNNVFDENDLQLMEYIKNQVEIAVTKHKLYKEIIYLSRYDKLTNIYNRRYFEELIDNSINKAIEQNEEILFVLFDLNGLKVVNDTYGHLAGDELIRNFARYLSSAFRYPDILARFGGDEFVGVFYDMDLQMLSHRLEEAIKYFRNNPMIFENNKIVCSFSYGTANFPKDARNYNELVKIADKRMYEYKRMINKLI